MNFNFNIKKSIWIAKENNLFAKNEFILMSATVLFLFVAWMFAWSIGFVNDFREMAYISSVGLAYLLISNIVAGYFTISSISKDIDWKYIYFILKSANRFEYIVWKLMSVLWVIIKLNVLFAIIFAFFYKFSVGKMDYNILYIPLFHILEAFVIGILAMVITFLSKNNIARIFFLITAYLVGHVIYPVKVMIDNWAINFWKFWNDFYIFLYKIFPNLESFNIRNVLPYNTDVAWMLLSSWIYTLLWMSLLTIATYFIFRKENL